jgi:hypothetical protein
MRDLKSRLIFDKQGIDKLLMDAIGIKHDMKVTKIKFFLESKQDGIFERTVISRLEVEGYHNSILSIYDEEDLLSGKIEATLD